MLGGCTEYVHATQLQKSERCILKIYSAGTFLEKHVCKGKKGALAKRTRWLFVV